MLELIKRQSSSTDHELFMKQKMYNDNTETTPTLQFIVQGVATDFQSRSNTWIVTINDDLLINIVIELKITLMLLST
jgi:hypothetical protein